MRVHISKQTKMIPLKIISSEYLKAYFWVYVIYAFKMAFSELYKALEVSPITKIY